MNKLLMNLSGWQTIVDVPIWLVWLTKITAILLAAWAIYFTLKRTNPRWRILLWRATAISLLVLPLAGWLFPALNIYVEKPVEVSQKMVNPAAAEMTTHNDKDAGIFPVYPRPKAHATDFSFDPLRETWSHPSHETPSRLVEASPEVPSSEDAKLPQSMNAEKESRPAVSSTPAPTVPTTVASRPTSVPWTIVLAVLWLGGVLVLGLRLCWGHCRVLALVNRARLAPQAVCEECRLVAESIGCRRTVCVIRSKEISSPFIFGFLRPRLLLPERMCRTAYRDDLPGILAHELTHIRSRDVLWNIGLQMISIFLWFHPLIWRMRKAHLAACELASDAASANYVGDVSGYCRTLARVAVDACGALPASGIAMARTSMIMHRLTRLKERVFHLPLRRRSVIGFGLSMLLAVTVLGVLQFAFAEPAEKETLKTTASTSSEAEEQKPSDPFVVTLPNGTKVEVLGVREHHSRDKKWWKPDGSPLEKPLYDPAKFHARVLTGEGRMVREIAYRISPGKDDGTWFTTDFRDVGSSAENAPLKALDGSGMIRARAVEVGKSQPSCSLRVEYSAGEWTTHHTTKRGGGSIGGNVNLIVSHATEVKGAPKPSATLTVCHEMRDRDVRVVAIDLDGRQHQSNGANGFGAGEHLNMISPSFYGLPLAKVKEFRIQSRPKQWVELKNISLQPGQKTQPEIIRSEEPKELKEPKTPKTPSLSKSEMTVTGVVVDEQGQPEEGVEVKFFGHTGFRQLAMVAKTDKEGRFRFYDPNLRSCSAIHARTSDGARQAYRSNLSVSDVDVPLRMTMRPAQLVEASVSDGQGKPIAGATVAAFIYPEVVAEGRSDEQGKCVLRVPADHYLQNLYAQKPGQGFDYVSFRSRAPGYSSGKPSYPAGKTLEVPLTLDGVKTARIKLVDPEGKPVEGIKVCPVCFTKKNDPIQEKWKKFCPNWLEKRFCVKTDADGVAVFDCLPAWCPTPFIFMAESEDREWVTKNFAIEFDPNNGEKEVTRELVRAIPLRGQLRFPDGKPGAGIEIEVHGLSTAHISFYQRVRADEQGQFEFRLRPDSAYMLVSKDQHWVLTKSPEFFVKDKPIKDLGLSLQPATKIYGHVTVGPKNEPMGAKFIRVIQKGPDLRDFLSDKEKSTLDRTGTDTEVNFLWLALVGPDGSYQLAVGPGDYELSRVGTYYGVSNPLDTAVKKLSVKNEKTMQVDFHEDRCSEGPLYGKVVLKGDSDKPVADAEVVSISCADKKAYSAVTDSEGKFYVERRYRPTMVYVTSKDGRLAGIVQLDGEEKRVTIPLQPTTTAEGRLLDAQTGKPLADRELQYHARIDHVPADHKSLQNWSTRLNPAVKTDADGRFKLPGLVVGAEYNLHVLPSKQDKNALRILESFEKLVVSDAKPIQLGNLKARIPDPNRRPYYVPAMKPIAKPSNTEEKSATEKKTKTMLVRILGPDGKPLHGAKLHASIWTKEKGFKHNRDYKTDAQGFAEVKLPKTYYIVRLWASKKPFVTIFAHWEQAYLASNELPKEYTIHLENAVTAGGRIVEEEGKPVVGAKVRVMEHGGTPRKEDGRTSYSTWLATGSDTAVTDAEGRWHIENVPDHPKTELTLLVTHPDYISDENWGGLQKVAHITTEMLLKGTDVLTLKRGAVVEGQVTDPEGKPIKDAIIVQGDHPYDSENPCRFITDAKGRYHLPVLKPQELALTAMAPGFAPQRRVVKVEPGMPPQNFRMAPGKTIELRFIDTQGKPIPKVYVGIRKWEKSESIQSQIRPGHPKVPSTKIPSRTDKNGIWRWTFAPEGTIELEIYRKGFVRKTLKVAAGEPTRTVTLKGEYRITGKVTDAVTGKPIPSFTVVPLRGNKSGSLVLQRGDAESGKNGQLDYLAESDQILQPVEIKLDHMRLQVEAMGYRTQLGPEFRVGDDSPRVQNFQLQPSKPISGVVLGIDGQPARGAEVLVATSTESIYLEFDRLAHQFTDAKGRFAFPDPGTPIIVVAQSKDGFVRADFPANRHDLGTLRLQKWASVRGQFYDGGKPVKDATIFLRSILPGKSEEPRFDNPIPVRTDGAGRFEFSRVPPGLVQVQVVLGPWRDASYRSGPSVPLDLKPGEHVELNELGKGGVTVEGKVELTGKIPEGLDCSYSLNYLIRHESGVEPPASIDRKKFDIRRYGWQESWLKTAEGHNYLRTLQHWFVKLKPDGSFRVSGVPTGEYDLVMQIFEKSDGCLVEPAAERVIPITITEEDTNRGTLTLPDVKVKVQPGPKVGSTPSLEFHRPDGGRGSLADFRGRYTVVHFWAGFCETCKEQFPDLKKLQEQKTDSKPAMLGLAVYDTPESWKASLKKLDLPWPQGRVDSKTATVSRVPLYWLLDPQGKLIGKFYNPKTLAEELEKRIGAARDSSKQNEDLR